jgi:hypothetical protein
MIFLRVGCLRLVVGGIEFQNGIVPRMGKVTGLGFVKILWGLGWR